MAFTCTCIFPSRRLVMYRGPRGASHSSRGRGDFGFVIARPPLRPRTAFASDGYRLRPRPFLPQESSRGAIPPRSSATASRDSLNSRPQWPRGHWQQHHPWRSEQSPCAIQDEPAEPTMDDSSVTLDWYNSDLNLMISRDTLCSAHPLHSGGFGHVWAGARATHGVNRGRVCFEVRIDDLCPISIDSQPGEATHVLRVGWSLDTCSMQLGEEKHSYGFGGTGKISHDSKFFDYGGNFGQQGDVVGCHIDLSVDPIQVSFSVNGRDKGVAFLIDRAEIGEKPLFPHILSKNVAFTVNFGQLTVPLAALKPDHGFIGCIQGVIRGTRSPASRKLCQVLMMIGLPGAGKTYWAECYSRTNPQYRFNILGTNSLIDRMKVMGLPRRRNYHGRWEALIEQCTECFQKLIEIAASRRRNYIIDQTNVYPTARLRKLKPLAGFTRKMIVVVPPDPEFLRRIASREVSEGKAVPEEAVLGMKANFVLPDIEEREHVDDVLFTDLGPEEASMLVTQYNAEANAKGHTTSMAVKAYMTRCTRMRIRDGDTRPLGRHINEESNVAAETPYQGAQDPNPVSNVMNERIPSANSTLDSYQGLPEHSRKRPISSVNDNLMMEAGTHSLGTNDASRGRPSSPKRARPSASPWMTQAQDVDRHDYPPSHSSEQVSGEERRAIGGFYQKRESAGQEDRMTERNVSSQRGRVGGQSLLGQSREDSRQEQPDLRQRQGSYKYQRVYEQERLDFGQQGTEWEQPWRASVEREGMAQQTARFDAPREGFGRHRKSPQNRVGLVHRDVLETRENVMNQRADFGRQEEAFASQQGEIEAESRYRRAGIEPREDSDLPIYGFDSREGHYEQSYERASFQHQSRGMGSQSFRGFPRRRGFSRPRGGFYSGFSTNPGSNERFDIDSSFSNGPETYRATSSGVFGNTTAPRGFRGRPGTTRLGRGDFRESNSERLLDDQRSSRPDSSSSYSRSYGREESTLPHSSSSRNESSTSFHAERKPQGRERESHDWSEPLSPPSSFSHSYDRQGSNASWGSERGDSRHWYRPSGSGMAFYNMRNNSQSDHINSAQSWNRGASRSNAPSTSDTENLRQREEETSREDGVMDYNGLLQYLQFYQKRMGGNGGDDRRE